MLTRCKPRSLAFQGCRDRKVTVAFDGGSITIERRGAAAQAGGPLHRALRPGGRLFHRPGPASHRTFGADTGGADHRPWGTTTSNQRPRRLAARPAAGVAVGQARGTPEGLRTAGGQGYAEPGLSPHMPAAGRAATPGSTTTRRSFGTCWSSRSSAPGRASAGSGLNSSADILRHPRCAPVRP